MMHYARIGAAMVVLVALSGLAPASARSAYQRDSLTTAEIAQKVTASVVTITGATGFGSGVVVDASGVVVTNLHVVQGETALAVELASGDIYDDVEVIDVDARRDLILLKIKAFNLTTAVFGDSDNVQVGAEVVLVGSPEGLDQTVSEGIISAVRDLEVGYRVFQTSAPASPGSSGGGMFNADGELIGIVTSQFEEGQNLNFAVPVNYARGMFATDATMTLADLAESAVGAGGTTETAADIDASLQEFDPASVARLEALVDSSELEFEATNEVQWLVSLPGGDNLADIDVTVELLSDDLIFVRGWTADPEGDLTLAQLQALVTLNFELNIAKVSVDSGGSVWAHAEVELRTLDARGLVLVTLYVASATDELAGIVAEGQPR